MIRAAGVALLGFSLLVTGGCADGPLQAHPAAQLRDPAPGGRDTEVFVIKRGWHIDVGVAVPALTTPLRPTQALLPQAKYLLFGFGDRRYLTARSRRLDALLAALRPGAALVLLTGLPDTPQDAFGAQAVRTLTLRPGQMQALQAFIWGTLAHPRGALLSVQSGPYPGSRYLAALPRYSGLHTCNTWAAEALQAAGLPVHARGVVFAWQLWMQLPRLRRAGQGMAAPPRTPAVRAD